MYKYKLYIYIYIYIDIVILYGFMIISYCIHACVYIYIYNRDFGIPSDPSAFILTHSCPLNNQLFGGPKGGIEYSHHF